MNPKVWSIKGSLWLSIVPLVAAPSTAWKNLSTAWKNLSTAWKNFSMVWKNFVTAHLIIACPYLYHLLT